MTTKPEAEEKINAAIKTCDQVMASWRAAYNAIAGAVSVNGYGIFDDQFQMHNKLQDARRNIDEALRTLAEIDFPTKADYDQL